MSNLKAKLVPALVALSVSIVSLAVFVFMLTGSANFTDVFSAAIGYMAGISSLAGLVRIFIPGLSHVRSILCGLIVAGVGYLAVLGYAVSRI